MFVLGNLQYAVGVIILTKAVWEPKSSSSTVYPPAVPAWPAGTDQSGWGFAQTTSRQV
jgi:hypothetical protein